MSGRRLSGVVCLLLASCASQPPPEPPQPQLPPDFISISWETPAGEPRPSAIFIERSGKIYLTSFETSFSIVRFDMSPEEIKDLFEAAQNWAWPGQHFDDRNCAQRVSDMGWMTVKMQIGGSKGSIIHDWGCLTSPLTQQALSALCNVRSLEIVRQQLGPPPPGCEPQLRHQESASRDGA